MANGIKDKKQSFQLVSTYPSKMINVMIATSGVKKWLKILLFIYNRHQIEPMLGARYKAVVKNVIVISAKAMILIRKRILGKTTSFLTNR